MIIRNNVYKILKIASILIICLPLLQENLRIVKEKNLSGYFKNELNISFSWKNWFNENFQKQKEKYLTNNFGFRNTFVRINNQIWYSFFNKTHHAEAILGKNGIIFNNHTIVAYKGPPSIDKDTIIKKAHIIKFIQDTLHKLNKYMVFVFVPTKARFYANDFPASYDLMPKLQNDYEVIKYVFDSLKINYFDAINYLENNFSSEFPVFPKYGLHWSMPAALFTLDTLSKFLEKSINKKMNHIIIEKITTTCPIELNNINSDYEIIESMNLLFYKKNKNFYPIFHFENDTTKYKPKILIIADSFFFLPYGFKYSSIFSKLSFWYYNRESFTQSYFDKTDVNNINLPFSLQYNDIIMLLFSETSLHNLGYGFYENTYHILINNLLNQIDYGLRDYGMSAIDQNIQNYVRSIVVNPSKYEEYKQKASNLNIHVDSLLLQEARETLK